MGNVMNKADSAGDNDQPGSRVPTLDGTRVRIGEINVGSLVNDTGTASGSWFKRARIRLSQFLAGMYTGVGCSGVPHSHHTYGPDRDNRPL